MSSYDSDREPQPELTRILDAAARGDSQATAQLLAVVYDELRRLARARLAHLGPNESLTPTELVHEAYLRMVARPTSFEGRRHFFFAASRAMRDILVENARRKASSKRGGGYRREEVDGEKIAVETPPEEILDLHLALEKLERESADRAQVVLLSYFGGLTHLEIAEVLGMSRATVERRWTYARSWLRRELSPAGRPRE